MGVGPECDARVGVAEAAGDGPDADPARGQRGGGEVAQRVERDAGQLEAVPQGSKGTGHPVGSVRGGAVEVLGPDVSGRREADVGHGSPLVDSFPVGSKHLDGGWVEGDAAGLVGLGVLDSYQLVGVGDGPGNRQRRKVEVEVAPAQPAQLASPGAGCGGDIDDAAEVFVVVGASLQEAAEFFPGGGVDLPYPLIGRRRPEYRVGVEPTPAQGLVEGGGEDGVALADTERCKTGSAQLGVVPVDIGRSKFIDGLGAEAGLDVGVDAGPVAGEGRLRSSLSLDVGHPSVEQFVDCVPAFLPVAAPVNFGDQFGSGSLGVPLGALDVPPDVAVAAGLGVT